MLCTCTYTFVDILDSLHVANRPNARNKVAIIIGRRHAELDSHRTSRFAKNTAKVKIKRSEKGIAARETPRDRRRRCDLSRPLPSRGRGKFLSASDSREPAIFRLSLRRIEPGRHRLTGHTGNSVTRYSNVY